jgi:hypothetical protein
MNLLQDAQQCAEQGHEIGLGAYSTGGSATSLSATTGDDLTMARPTPNFVILNGSFPDVGRLVAAMLKARAAVESRSWAHPQEPVTDEWWATYSPILARASESGAAAMWWPSARSIASPTSRVTQSWSVVASASGKLPTVATS